MKEQEWTIHYIQLPEDEYDEDDELDERLEAAAKKKKNHVTRGGFFGTH